jgi:hypothetical protein
MVCARGIEVWVRTLCERADNGDQEAELALEKLRDAFETASKLCNDGRELTEDEFVPLYEGLLILEQAAQGRPGYPREVLRVVAKQTLAGCMRLGFDPPDVSFLLE